MRHSQGDAGLGDYVETKAENQGWRGIVIAVGEWGEHSRTVLITEPRGRGPREKGDKVIDFYCWLKVLARYEGGPVPS